MEAVVAPSLTWWQAQQMAEVEQPGLFPLDPAMFLRRAKVPTPFTSGRTPTRVPGLTRSH